MRTFLIRLLGGIPAHEADTSGDWHECMFNELQAAQHSCADCGSTHVISKTEYGAYDLSWLLEQDEDVWSAADWIQAHRENEARLKSHPA